LTRTRRWSRRTLAGRWEPRLRPLSPSLGYSSWEGYYAAEFNESGSRGWHLINAARVVRALEESQLTNVSPPTSEGVVRELVPVLRENPERVEEVWAEVVEE
jgi:hypothetical protein